MGKIIGIDLGTTNSCVAVFEGNEPVVIANSEGKRTTPSVIGFVKDGERKVGDPAKRQAITNPKNTIFSIKRFMGETFEQCSKEITRVPYTVVNENGYPRVDIDGRKYTPQEISAMILQKMKKTAEDYLGQEKVLYFFSVGEEQEIKRQNRDSLGQRVCAEVAENARQRCRAFSALYKGDNYGKGYDKGACRPHSSEIFDTAAYKRGVPAAVHHCGQHDRR